MLHGDLTDLAQLLNVRPSGTDRFLGDHPGGSRHRVYGGQFLGQALMAAANGRAEPIRSLHAQFLRPGSLQSPIEYRRAQLAPNCTHIDAWQSARLAFTMDMVFGEQIPHPACVLATGPDHAIPRERGIVGLPTDTDASWACVDGPFETCFVENIWDPEYRAPCHDVWFRGRARTDGEITGSTSTDTGSHFSAAALAYFSDDTLMDNALFPHNWMWSWDHLQTASLDHSMWFHAQTELDEWMCFVQRSDVAGFGRGMTSGIIHAADGRAIVSVAQEILMRVAR